MSRQRLVIGVTGSSAPQLAWAVLGALHASQAVETHLVLSAGAEKTIAAEMGLTRDSFEALADVSHHPSDGRGRLRRHWHRERHTRSRADPDAVPSHRRARPPGANQRPRCGHRSSARPAALLARLTCLVARLSLRAETATAR